MSFTTIYDVKLRYSVDDRARGATRGLTNDVKALSGETGRVTGLMLRAGAAIVAAFSVRAGAKALIGFNSTVEDTKLQIAGMLALVKKTDLSEQISKADGLYASLQRRAKSLPGTTQEYVQMAGMLTQPITDAGLGLKALEDLTVNSVVGAKALGIQWEVAARDIDAALRGQFHSVDQFTGKLLGGAGYKGEEGREKFNAMDAGKRAEVLQSVLMQKQLVQLAAAQGDTFSGVLSTFQDTVGQFFGKVGLPLFKALSAELKNWNSWLDGNEQKVNAFATKLADGLVTGFSMVKDAVGFLVDHADTIIMIGKVWAATKIGGMLAGGISKGSGALTSGTGMLDRFAAWNKRATPWSDTGDGSSEGGTFWSGGYNAKGGEAAGAGRQSWKAGGVVNGLSSAAQAFGGGYAIGTVLNEWTGASSKMAEAMEVIRPHLDETSTKFYQLENSITDLDAATKRAAENAEGKTGFGKNFGGVASTNFQGVIDQYKQHVNLFDDWQQAFKNGDWELTASKQKAFEAAGGDAKKIGFERSEVPRLIELGNANRSAAEQLWLRGFQSLNATELKALDQAETQTQILNYIKAPGVLDRSNPLLNLLGTAGDDIVAGMVMRGDGSAKKTPAPNVNITIQRIEVQSDDPDRYAFGLVEAFRDAVKNPSAAVRTIREG